MAKFDPEEEKEDIFEKIKSDLQDVDGAIQLLITEATQRSGTAVLKHHDVANPLAKLLASKQKFYDQLLKIIEMESLDKEVEFDINNMYAEYEEKTK